MDSYIAAKTHIFDRQGQDDLAVLGYDDDATGDVYRRWQTRGGCTSVT